MENRRAFIIAGICFIVSLVLITAYVRVKRYELTKEFGEEVTVVTATQDIPEYTIIQKSMLEVVPVFKSFRQPQTVTDVNDIVGKASYVAIGKGEQVTLTKLVNQDGKPVLDRQVEKKMRAITLNIAPHTGVGRLIRPGNRVDILTTASYDSSGSTVFEVKTLVQNVLVLATGKNIQNEVPTRVNREVLNVIQGKAEEQRRKDIFGNGMETLNTSRPDDNYSYVTLQLSPQDAERSAIVFRAFSGALIVGFSNTNSTTWAQSANGQGVEGTDCPYPLPFLHAY
jgi:pilus assembly protein CpaB